MHKQAYWDNKVNPIVMYIMKEWYGDRKVEKSPLAIRTAKCQSRMQQRNRLHSIAGCISKYASSAEARTRSLQHDAGSAMAVR
jgi:hypothetical protein